MPMRIGILPTTDASFGGIYQYSQTILHALDQWRSHGGEDRFVVFANETTSPAIAALASGGWTIEALRRPTLASQAVNVLRRIAGEGPYRSAWRRLRSDMAGPPAQQQAAPLDPDGVQSRPAYGQWFKDCGVDLMIYPAPTSLSFEAGVPYIMAIHDLQHRLQPEFPEVSADGEWERREYRYRNGTRNATLLLADSEVGKEDILNFYGPYGVTPDQVEVLPLLPACYLASDISEAERQRVRRIHRLPERYLFYPAQFWPHKNHARIIRALGSLKRDRDLTIPIVFLGSHTGELRERTFCEVMALSSHLGIEAAVHYLGYLRDEDMSGMYAEASGLVMPTFFGPTNIPILEAWAFGCPVLTSDIRGVREQVGHAGLLVDPRSVDAIADGIYRLWTDGDLARTLAGLGRRRLGEYTPNDHLSRLVAIIQEAKTRLSARKPKAHALG